jgi:hypothetical protein
MVDDVAGGLTVGKTEVTDFGSCSDLYGGGEFQGFHTCKAQFDSFSPDGSTVLGTVGLGFGGNPRPKVVTVPWGGGPEKVLVPGGYEPSWGS